MNTKKGRYSGLIRPILYIIDITLLVLFIIYLHPGRANSQIFYPFLIIGWIISTFFTRYYNIYRFTSLAKIIIIASRQYLIYTFIYFSYFSFGPTTLEIPTVFYYLLALFFAMLFFKCAMYWALKKYRLKGGNRRNTIIIGNNKATQDLAEFFLKKTIYGYNYLGFFTNQPVNDKIGSFSDSFGFIQENKIDDIYCAVNEINKDETQQLIKYANTHFKTLKFIPDSHQILATGFEVDYYDYFPVLSMSKIALNVPFNRFLKRLFDVVFSIIIIIAVLSWLMPLLYTF